MISGLVSTRGGSWAALFVLATACAEVRAPGDASIAPTTVDAAPADGGSVDGGVLSAADADAPTDAASQTEVTPDPVSWRTVAPLATARINHAATLLADGRVLVVSTP